MYLAKLQLRYWRSLKLHTSFWCYTILLQHYLLELVPPWSHASGYRFLILRSGEQKSLICCRERSGLAKDITSCHTRFSAGSDVGLALLHVLKEIKSVRTKSVLGAIACHQPSLHSLKCRYTIVDGHFALYNQHFGKYEHNYSHWLWLQLECGTFSLPHLMMRYDEAALAQSSQKGILSYCVFLKMDLLIKLSWCPWVPLPQG